MIGEAGLLSWKMDEIRISFRSGLSMVIPRSTRSRHQDTRLLLDDSDPRFRETDWNYIAGLRRRNLHGGQFEATQEFGHVNNNSVFFNDEARSISSMTSCSARVETSGRLSNRKY